MLLVYMLCVTVATVYYIQIISSVQQICNLISLKQGRLEHVLVIRLIVNVLCYSGMLYCDSYACKM